jgi:8-oxo-dGTP pyrophosphatase MutT (NUDIX family)
MIWTPHVTVATVVEHDGRFLLVYENADGKNVYNQPAGHLDEDETLIDAAVRETLEETGWTVKPTAVLNVRLYESPHNGITYLRTTFIAETVSYNPEARLDDGIIEAVWLTREELEACRDELRSPMTLQVIDDYLAGCRYPLEVVAPGG